MLGAIAGLGWLATVLALLDYLELNAAFLTDVDFAQFHIVTTGHGVFSFLSDYE
jgi:hypothetical protein